MTSGARPRSPATDEEDAERAAAVRKQPSPSRLAEANRIREVDRRERARRVGIFRLDVVLRHKAGGGHHHRVDPAERGPGGIERRDEGVRPIQVAPGDDGWLGQPRAHLQVARRCIESVAVAAEEADRIAPLRQEPRDGAPHPARRAEQDNVHAGSPRTRTDCALRRRNSGSHCRRTAVQRPRRGSIARKCSARV